MGFILLALDLLLWSPGQQCEADTNRVIMMAFWTAVRKGWGQKVTTKASTSVCGMRERAGERPRSPSHVTHSSAVKCRAAGRLDRMIFADPEQQEYFHELIPSGSIMTGGGVQREGEE